MLNLTHTEKNKVKVAPRYQFSPSILQKSIRLTYVLLARTRRNTHSYMLLVATQNGISPNRKSQNLPQLPIHFPFDLITPILEIYLSFTYTSVKWHMYIYVIIIQSEQKTKGNKPCSQQYWTMWMNNSHTKKYHAFVKEKKQSKEYNLCALIWRAPQDFFPPVLRIKPTAYARKASTLPLSHIPGPFLGYFLCQM